MEYVHPSRRNILTVMHRLGRLPVEIARAERELPELVDLQRDRRLLDDLGLHFGADMARFGGGPD